MLAIIGGSGLNQLSGIEALRREAVTTPYGDPSAALSFGALAGRPIVFLARHGDGHTIPPHRVNYCANVWALKQAQATRILSVATVGGIRADLKPGMLVVPHQIIDYTWGRRGTFHDGDSGAVVHIDFTEPYDEALRSALLGAAREAGQGVIDGGVYATTQGPRLESAAEIDRLERDGADVVGMTGMPEAALAREAGLPYAAVVVVANYAAGRGDSARAIQFERIEATLESAMSRVRRVIERLCGSDDREKRG